MKLTSRLELPLDAVNVKVVALSGSLREGSYTTMALRVALEGAAEVAATVKLIDLRDYKLTFALDNHQWDTGNGVERLRAEVKTAQGILIGTPEYHGSLAGYQKCPRSNGLR